MRGCSIFVDIMGTLHPQIMKNYSYSHTCKRIHKIKSPQNCKKKPGNPQQLTPLNLIVSTTNKNLLTTFVLDNHLYGQSPIMDSCQQQGQHGLQPGEAWRGLSTVLLLHCMGSWNNQTVQSEKFYCTYLSSLFKKSNNKMLPKNRQRSGLATIHFLNEKNCNRIIHINKFM